MLLIRGRHFSTSHAVDVEKCHTRQFYFKYIYIKKKTLLEKCKNKYAIPVPKFANILFLISGRREEEEKGERL